MPLVGTSLPQQQSLKAKELAGSMADLASLSHTVPWRIDRMLAHIDLKHLETVQSQGEERSTSGHGDVQRQEPEHQLPQRSITPICLGAVLWSLAEFC